MIVHIGDLKHESADPSTNIEKDLEKETCFNLAITLLHILLIRSICYGGKRILQYISICLLMDVCHVLAT